MLYFNSKLYFEKSVSYVQDLFQIVQFDTQTLPVYLF